MTWVVDVKVVELVEIIHTHSYRQTACIGSFNL